MSIAKTKTKLHKLFWSVEIHKSYVYVFLKTFIILLHNFKDNKHLNVNKRMFKCKWKKFPYIVHTLSLDMQTNLKKLNDFKIKLK